MAALTVDVFAREIGTPHFMPTPSVWSDGNTTGTVPTQYPTGPYLVWHGALVPDWKELVRRLEPVEVVEKYAQRCVMECE